MVKERLAPLHNTSARRPRWHKQSVRAAAARGRSTTTTLTLSMTLVGLSMWHCWWSRCYQRPAAEQSQCAGQMTTVGYRRLVDMTRQCCPAVSWYRHRYTSTVAVRWHLATTTADVINNGQSSHVHLSCYLNMIEICMRNHSLFDLCMKILHKIWYWYLVVLSLFYCASCVSCS